MRARRTGTGSVRQRSRVAPPATIAAVVAVTLVGGSLGAWAAPSDGAPPAPAPAAPAAEALSAGSYTGTFSNVADAPTGSKPVAGKATMVISASGTKVSIDATGLDPKAVYVAHVHNQPCATEEGGKHFQFDPSGPMAPPNEIWLTPVKVSPKGTGTATVTAPGKANSSAKSVVIHLKQAAGAPPPEAGAKPPKLACADLAHK